MKNNILRINTLYSMVYQFVVLFVPLITAPYLARTIGSTGLGSFSYSQSIAYYFFLVAMLGVNNYGSREIAQTTNNKDTLSDCFWQIYYIQFFLGFVSLLGYCIFCEFFVPDEDIIMFRIQAILVFSVVLDINWFTYGLEKFKYVTIRNLIVKIYTVTLIFLLIKTKEDAHKYALIIETGTIVGLIPNWNIVFKETKWKRPNIHAIIKHLRPNAVLFLPFFASSIYHYLDKAMLGWICTKNDVGFYTYAENIINVPMGIITAVCNVFMPHISKLLSQKKVSEVKNLTNRVIHLTGIIEIIIFFGLFMLGKDFVLIYLGDDFYTTGIVLEILAIIIILSGTGNVIKMTILIPFKEDSLYAKSVTVGAIFNAIANIVLIKTMGIYGACVATIAAYGIVIMIQYTGTKFRVDYKNCLIKLTPYFFFGIIMSLALCFIRLDNLILTFLIKILVGGFVYFALASIWVFIFKKDIYVLELIRPNNNHNSKNMKEV